MGLLDTLGGKLNKNMADPLRMGLLAYGMTGQGNDPGGTAINTMISTAKAKAEAEKAARELAAKQAMQQAVTGAFASGSVDPALLAQYSASGGEGSKEMLDLYKFGRTPQSVAPGQMMIDPTTGKMSMPAPKMGEGQMWDGQRVSNASGYLEAYGNQKAVDAQTAIDEYGAKQGIGYQYDLGRIGQQTQADIAKYGAQQGIGYGYDVGKMDYADQITRGQEAFKAGLGAQGDLREVENPDGSRSYTSRADILAGGGMAAPSPEHAAYMAERTKSNAATYQGALDAAGNAGQQLSNIDRMASLLTDIETGKGEQALMGLASIGEQIGIKIDPKLGDKQAVQSLANQLAIGMRQPGTGTMTDKDMEVFLQSVPSLQNSPDGNRKIMQTMAAFAEKKQVEASMMQKYAERNGGMWDDRGEKMLNEWRKNNPIKW
jgi:hypothetical protein